MQKWGNMEFEQVVNFCEAQIENVKRHVGGVHVLRHGIFRRAHRRQLSHFDEHGICALSHRGALYFAPVGGAGNGDDFHHHFLLCQRANAAADCFLD